MKKTKLNLGCGDEHLDEYINIDIIQTEATDLVMDATKLTKFENDSVDEILASHLIEHFSFLESWKAINEWNRILKPDGKLVIEVPDLEELMKLYLETDFKGKFHCYQKPQNPPLVMHIFGNRGDGTPYDYHRSGYTKEYLLFLLNPLFENIQFGKPVKDVGCPVIHVECTKKPKEIVSFA